MRFQRFPAFQPIGHSKAPTRFQALDGLRGWAALSVVAFHMLWETFGQIIPAIRNPFTAGLLDGGLAVSIFFVLSGEALSVSFFAGKGPKAAMRLAIKRYPRLALPVLGIAAIITALIVARLTFHTHAAVLVGRTDWMGQWLTAPAGVLPCLRYALLDVFTGAGSNRTQLDPFLWTMRLELFGSALVFLLLFMLNGRSNGWYVVIALLALSVPLDLVHRDFGQLGCFLAGMTFARLRVGGAFDALARNPRWNRVGAAILIAVLVADGVLHWQGVLSRLTPLWAVLLVFAISSTRINTLMETPLSGFMGRISFPLFLVQFPVLISATSFAIIAADQHGLLLQTAPLIASGSVALAIGAAVLFEPMEHLTKSACNLILQATLQLADSARPTLSRLAKAVESEPGA